MKKTISVLLLIALVLSLCACSKSNSDGEAVSEKADTNASSTMQTVLDSTEYVLYQNIFYNDKGADYEGQTVTKKGTFATIIDKYNDTTRYYVWGYNDQTKCCDYQWELNITDTSNLPSNGSLIEVSGTFTASESALDGYWIDNPSVSVESEYKSSEYDIDMTTLDATLERVQLINMQNYYADFEGKTVCVYGRVETPTSVEHPYYDGAFSQAFESSDDIPAIGTVVIVSGVYSNGVITDASVEETDMF
ncbi:MAG: hypothetical protein ACI4IQ_01005 [Eubacterium sp.]